MPAQLRAYITPEEYESAIAMSNKLQKQYWTADNNHVYALLLSGCSCIPLISFPASSNEDEQASFEDVILRSPIVAGIINNSPPDAVSIATRRAKTVGGSARQLWRRRGTGGRRRWSARRTTRAVRDGEIEGSRAPLGEHQMLKPVDPRRPGRPTKRTARPTYPPGRAE